MSLTRKQLLTEARELPLTELQEFIEDLRQLGAEDELSPEQKDELRRRTQTIDRGEGEMIDGEQAMKERFAGLQRRPENLKQ